MKVLEEYGPTDSFAFWVLDPHGRMHVGVLHRQKFLDMIPYSLLAGPQEKKKEKKQMGKKVLVVPHLLKMQSCSLDNSKNYL